MSRRSERAREAAHMTADEFETICGLVEEHDDLGDAAFFARMAELGYDADVMARYSREHERRTACEAIGRAP